MAGLLDRGLLGGARFLSPSGRDALARDVPVGVPDRFICDSALGLSKDRKPDTELLVLDLHGIHPEDLLVPGHHRPSRAHPKLRCNRAAVSRMKLRPDW